MGMDYADDLFEAASKGRISRVKYLLDNGALINKSSMTGTSPLSIACQEGHQGVVRLLLNNESIEVDHINNCGETALHLAVRGNHKKIIELLLDNKACVNKRKRLSERTPLCEVLYTGDVETMQLLLAYGADPLITMFNLFTNTPYCVFDVCDAEINRIIYRGRGAYLSKRLKKLSWPRIRLLWIGMKEADCLLSLLPRDMIKHISSFDLSSEKEKGEIGWFALERAKQKYLMKSD